MQGGRDSSTCADGTIKITLILLCLHRRVIDVCREQDRQMQGYFLRRESPKMTFGILRLGDAVQRQLRHPEPSSWSHKSTTRKSIRNKKLLNKKIHATKYSNHPHPQVKKLRLTPQLVSHSSFSFPLQ